MARYVHKPYKVPGRVVFPPANTVPELMRAMRAGFDLVTVLDKNRNDAPRWALMKNGKVSRAGSISAAAANVVSTRYCEREHAVLKGGTILYKLKPRDLEPAKQSPGAHPSTST